MQMSAARALEIEREFARQVSAGLYLVPQDMERKGDRLAYEAMQAARNYRRYLLSEEARRQNDPDCRHDVCPICGAHLDRDEKCDCGQGP